MAELRWYEAFPPRGCQLSEVTAVMRVLAGRSRHGLWRRTPIVAFECWISQNNVRWLMGLDERLASTVPAQLLAQLASLDLADVDTPPRPTLRSAMTIRSATSSYPLTLDNAAAVAAGCLHIASTLRKREQVVMQFVIGPSASRHTPPNQFTVAEALGLRPPRKSSVGEQRGWSTKVEEPLFAVQGRLGAVARNTMRANGLLKLAANALSLANGPEARLQSSRPSQATAERLIAVVGSGRTWTSVLNASELAMLATWPLTGVRVPGQNAVLLGRPPASLLLPLGDKPTPGERILGTAIHPADKGRLATMPAASTPFHLHILGPTGSGKSNLLAELILSDAAAGRSVLVVEPKGDLIRDVLERLPERLHSRVVVLEPNDIGPVVGFNPLAGPLEEAERRADELLHLFRMVFGASIGPRSADVLLHSLITAARLSDGTLVDVPMLLTNPQFRRRALAKVNDPLVLAPFWAQFDSFSDAERTQVIAPVLNKLRTFLSRTSVRRMLSQATPGFALDELFTKQRIVLINLNKGLLGSEAAQLLGQLLLTTGLWPAIRRQATVPANQRRSVAVAVDEFQDFLGTLDFAEVLAMSRGLGASWSVAHQHLGQLNTELLAAVLANARSRVTFRPAPKDLRALATAFGGRVVPEDLEQLGAYEACVQLVVNGAASTPFGLCTLQLPKASQNAAMLRRASQDRYGMAPTDLDSSLAVRIQGGTYRSEASIGVTRRGLS